MNPRQMIAETLRDGRRWKRSFLHFKQPLEAMIRDGEVHLVRPENGRARNMVELTERGWLVYFGENLLVARLDQFADLIAMGLSQKDAARELRMTPAQAAKAWSDITARLGAQAA